MRRRALSAAVLVLAAVGCARRTGSFPGAPVVLISVDTLRADHLPMYGYTGVRTPALDGLRKDSVLFDNAYSQAPLTVPSHATVLTGLFPYQHGVRDNTGFRLSASHRTLASVLKARGYATGAAVSSYVLERDRGLSAGFDFYDDVFDTGSADERPGARSAERLESWASGVSGKPLFLFLHLYEPHRPYAPPEPFRSEYGTDPYDGEIAAADAVVGRFVEFLKREGLYDRAILVFLSDHGEALGDHGEDDHGVFLYRETIRVPLLVKFPGSREAERTVRTAVGLVDVAATIADVTGTDLHAGGAGISLVPLARGERAPSRRIYSETLYPRLQLGWSDLASLTDDRFSFIEAPRPELYDLAKDPAQKLDLSSSHPDALRTMRAELLRLQRPAAAPDAASKEELEKLGSLGYIRIDPGSAARKNLPDPKDRIKELHRYKQLFDLFYSRRDGEAIVLARTILADNPQILSVWRTLATSLARQGRPAEAASALESALGRSDLTGSAEDVAQTVEELMTHLARTNSATAEKTLSGLIRRGIDAPPLRRELARLLHLKGRVAEGLALLEGAEKSTDAATLDVYGGLLAETGRLEEARTAFRRALEIDPNGATVLLHMGMLSLRDKDPAAAREWFTRSLAVQPDAPGTLAALGLAQVQLGDSRAALESWDRALVLDPSQYDTLFNRSVLAGRTGDTAGARRGLERFIASAPANQHASQIAEARKLLRALPGGRS